MIGVKNWKVNRSQVTREGKDITRVQLDGSFEDYQGRRVYFLEYHYYASNKMLQLLLTHSNRRKLRKDGALAYIKNFKRKYGF